MTVCERCGWRPIAASFDEAERQLASHIVEEHAAEVDVSIPPGMVQVKVDGEWMLMTPEEAREWHAEHHL